MDKMSMSELRILQNYPLELKIEKSKLRIREWYEYFNGEVYVSFSGGKDSTVLLHLVRSVYPDIEAVFCNTGVEYPEVVKFVKKQNNITIIRPSKSFATIVKEKGYPVVSKLVSRTIRLARANLKDGKTNTGVLRQLNGECPNRRFNQQKWKFLLDAPFKISEQCCDELKKKPFKKFQKETGKYPYMGLMACESPVRERGYLKTGCNAFDNRVIKSMPLGFWTEQDILEYIEKYNLEIAEVYGKVIKTEGEGKIKYRLTGRPRTGCMYCLFGIHLDKYPTRLDILKENYPKLYDYAINKLEIGKILDYINVKY